MKKLRVASLERQSIIQVTGHSSEKSLNDYDEGSEKEQQHLSNIISMPPQSVPWSQRFFLIFLRTREPRESPEAANTKNLWLPWT